MPHEFAVFIFGAKLAIFIAIMAYSIMISHISKKDKLLGINIFALAFIAIVLVQFFTIVEGGDICVIDGDTHTNPTEFFTEILALAAGLGLLIFFNSIEKNMKDYK